MKSIKYISILSLIVIFSSCSTSKQLSYEDDIYSTETDIVFVENNTEEDYYDPYEELYEDYDYYDDDNNTYITNNYYGSSRRYRSRHHRSYFYTGINYYPSTSYWGNSCCGMNYGYPYNNNFYSNNFYGYGHGYPYNNYYSNNFYGYGYGYPYNNYYSNNFYGYGNPYNNFYGNGYGYGYPYNNYYSNNYYYGNNYYGGFGSINDPNNNGNNYYGQNTSISTNSGSSSTYNGNTTSDYATVISTTKEIRGSSNSNPNQSLTTSGNIYSTNNADNSAAKPALSDIEQNKPINNNSTFLAKPSGVSSNNIIRESVSTNNSNKHYSSWVTSRKNNSKPSNINYTKPSNNNYTKPSNNNYTKPNNNRSNNKSNNNYTKPTNRSSNYNKPTNRGSSTPSRSSNGNKGGSNRR